MILPVTKYRRKGRKLAAWGGAVIILIIICAGVFHSQLGAVEPDTNEERPFIIKNGATPGEIARDLQSEGLIKSAASFMAYARLSGNISKFKTGEYLVKPSQSIFEIVDMLVKGRVVAVSFTIPEGLNLREIAKVLDKQGIVAQEDFWRVEKEGDFNYSFLQGLPKDERRLEGYLFPDTYRISKGMEPEKVIDMMLKRFEQVYKKLPANKTNLSAREVVILASIVEGESKLDKERPVIAGVFLNRLKINMKLDADATVQYLFDEHKERVLYKDLEIDSPYNTYRYKGLPPGPIGSPGEASLRAVLEPAESKYYYFVAKKDGSGEHVFSKTLAEQGRAKKLLGY